MNQDLHIEHIEIASITSNHSNPRAHPRKQIRQIAESIRAFGFRMPVLVDQGSQLICGHARVEACKLLNMERVPAVRVTDLSDDQLRALMIADNRLSEISTWDDRLLGEHLKVLSELKLDFDLESIGFDYGEIEQRVLAIEDLAEVGNDESDDLPETDRVARVSRVGDLWLLGEGASSHRVLCGDSTDPMSYEQLLGDHQASMIFTDPPYNLSARSIGRVCAEDHGDFEMAAGELASDEFVAFLSSVMERVCAVSEPGSIHYFFMDWRHAGEMLAAGAACYKQLKNLCVWVKDHPGMGTFYRSQHELVFVFKHGKAQHQNHFGLGEHGRTRSNVWCYPSVRSLDSADGDPSGDALRLHPTIKPVRLIEDAILDCSRRGQIVLDPFLGSGSTLIASEKSKRICVGIELSPRYVDVCIARWQQWTGGVAVHDATGMSYAQVAQSRSLEDTGEEA
ncbi:MAG: DNA methyltransferase [Planctomycetota bacterium]